MPAPDLFTGVLSPVVTPFDENLRPDGRRLVAQCNWLLSQNVGLAIFGTNSEGNSLSVGEKCDLLGQLVEGGIDPLQLMPGTGCCAPTDSVRLTQHAVDLGCGGVLMLPPFYYKGVSDDGLYASFANVIEQVGNENLRVYLYHIPPVSNVPISLSLIERLITDFPGTVVGIKDSSGDWNNTQAMLEREWDQFQVFAGSETFLLQTMRHGGAGCISATANVNPKAIHDLYVEWQAEDADDRQAALDAIRTVFQKHSMIPALKAAVAHYGGDSTWLKVRPPLEQLDAMAIQQLASDLDALQFKMPGLAVAAE